MAQLVRQTWSDILTEVKRSVGGQHYPDFDTRCKQWIQEAYFRFALTYNHYELQDQTVKTLLEDESAFEIPDTAFSILSVAEVDEDGDIVLVLVNKNEIIRQGLFNPTAGQPDSYARSSRSGIELQLNRPTDAERQYRVCFYRLPSLIDFAATAGPVAYSELHEVYDSAIIDLAVMRAAGKERSEEMMYFAEKLAQPFLEEQPTPAVVEEPAADLSETNLVNRPRGGLRG